MKIIVLAGGLSTERDVSLASAAGICRTLLEKGHDAFLLDVFLGLENAPEIWKTYSRFRDTVLKSQKISAPANRSGGCKGIPPGSVRLFPGTECY